MMREKRTLGLSPQVDIPQAAADGLRHRLVEP